MADAGPGRDCTRVPSRGPGTFPARPPHSQTRRQPSWFASAALGTRSHRELGTCACSPEVSPGSLGRFPCAGWDCKLQTSATRWAEGLETRRGLRALASWNQVVEAAGGRRGGPRASAARCHLGLGTFGAAAFMSPVRSGPAARGLCPAVVCASGLQPRWGPGALAWRRGQSNERLGEIGAETLRLAPRWRLRGPASKPGGGRVRVARRVGTHGPRGV